MIIIDILHLSKYTYEKEVFLEPQHFYFTPLCRPYFSVENYQMDVRPSPAGISLRTDLESNSLYQCWFQEPTEQLTIEARMRLSVQAFNPFDFLQEANVKKIHQAIMAPYVETVHLSSKAKSWVQDIFYLCNGNTMNFLSTLCQEVHQKWDHEARYDETLHAPDQCFTARKGSCRDLSWMLIQFFRHSHIPARFVSGYSYNPELGEGHELHAWVEAYVPGGGWIGIDPSSGLFTTEYYIPIATSYHPSNTLPVQGTFRGKGSSNLETKVEIKLR